MMWGLQASSRVCERALLVDARESIEIATCPNDCVFHISFLKFLLDISFLSRYNSHQEQNISSSSQAIRDS